MTHPGLAVMFVVGVGLGAILYYFFGNPHDESTGPYNNRRPGTGGRQESNRTYWSGTASSDPRNRRPDHECMICLDDTNKENLVQIVSCMHIFHKKCIEEWRLNGAGNARTCCPICRDIIIGLEEL